LDFPLALGEKVCFGEGTLCPLVKDVLLGSVEELNSDGRGSTGEREALNKLGFHLLVQGGCVILADEEELLPFASLSDLESGHHPSGFCLDNLTWLNHDGAFRTDGEVVGIELESKGKRDYGGHERIMR
jgi:hypothetical protein